MQARAIMDEDEKPSTHVPLRIVMFCSACDVAQPVEFESGDETYNDLLAHFRARGWTIEMDGARVRRAICPFRHGDSEQAGEIPADGPH